MSTMYGEGSYWRERKQRRNLARERIMRKAREEAKKVGVSIDLVLVGWNVRPRNRGQRIIDTDWRLGRFA